MDKVTGNCVKCKHHYDKHENTGYYYRHYFVSETTTIQAYKDRYTKATSQEASHENMVRTLEI